MRASVSVDDFLKHVYLIGKDDQQKVTSSLLAKSLQISNPAITDMARKLSRKGLIKYERYQALKLTPEGLNRALQLVRRHRLWETFLHQVLELDLHSIHKEAERLEHQSSDHLIERISAFLNHPQTDPHGDPIPNAKGEIAWPSNQKRLTELSANDQGTVTRLGYKTDENSMFYDKHELAIGQMIKVVAQNSADGSLEAECNGHRFYVGNKQASQIYIQPLC